MGKEIIWGTCWFNESINTVIDFLLESTKVLSSLNVKVIPIIFEAKIEHSEDEIKFIKSKIKDVIILQNNYDIFPNKNYGVAAIMKKAKELNIEYTAVVDCDWDITKSKYHMENMILALVNKNIDIIIPNIESSAGRSNILIGRTVMNLLYPEYQDTLVTPFPGSILGKTNKLYEIVNSDNYHYDWGGEWDLISLAISKNMKIESYPVKFNSVRHRCNLSKIEDSFQIWRAILSSIETKERIKNIVDYKHVIKPYNNLSKKILYGNYNVIELINIINSNDTSNTEKQLLYMIIYPIAYLTGIINEIPKIDNNENPYDKDELNRTSQLGIYCAKKLLTSLDKNAIINNVSNRKSIYLSDWTKQLQREAINKIEEV